MHIDKSHLITLGVVAVLIAGFCLGVWLPESRRVSTYRDRIAAAEEKLGPNFNQPTALTQRQSHLQSLREQLREEERIIPESAEIAALLRELSQAIADQDLDRQEVQTRTALHHLHYSEIPVELDLEGGFPSVYGLIDHVESMSRLTRVDALNLRVQTETPAATATAVGGSEPIPSPAVRASMRLASFFTPPSEPSP